MVERNVEVLEQKLLAEAKGLIRSHDEIRSILSKAQELGERLADLGYGVPDVFHGHGKQMQMMHES